MIGTVMRHCLVSAVATLLLHGTAQAASPWPEIPERVFTPEVARFLAPLPVGQYRSLQNGDEKIVASVKAQVAECVASGPIDPCVGMILDSAIYLDNPDQLEAAMVAAERTYPVDLTIVPGDRRIAGSYSAILAGVKRLDQIAAQSLSSYGAGDPRTIRRYLAHDIEEWRIGGPGIFTTSTIDTLERAQGLGAATVGTAKALAAVAMPFVTQRDTWLKDAHWILGDKAASIVAAVQLENGQYRAAVQSAFDGYAAMLSGFGQDDPHTIAAAAILARAYSDNGKEDLALPLARQVAANRRQDAYATDRQKIEAIVALAEVAPVAERETLNRQVLAMIDSALKKPQWPIAQAIAHEVNMQLSAIISDNAPLYEDDGRQALLKKQSDVYVQLGSARMATSPQEAKEFFRKAIAANPIDRLPKYLLAATILASANDLADLNRNGESVESLADVYEQFRDIPDDHPYRILQGMLLASYYIRWNAEHAPENARHALTAASKRIETHRTQDSSALSELGQLRSAFTIQVQSNWAAVQAQR